jgi:hypothetical protein
MGIPLSNSYPRFLLESLATGWPAEVQAGMTPYLGKDLGLVREYAVKSVGELKLAISGMVKSNLGYSDDRGRQVGVLQQTALVAWFSQ